MSMGGWMSDFWHQPILKRRTIAQQDRQGDRGLKGRRDISGEGDVLSSAGPGRRTSPPHSTYPRGGGSALKPVQAVVKPELKWHSPVGLPRNIVDQMTRHVCFLWLLTTGSAVVIGEDNLGDPAELAPRRRCGQEERHEGAVDLHLGKMRAGSLEDVFFDLLCALA